MNMDNEIFKEIPKYKGLYEISNLGRVKSLYLEYIDSSGRNQSKRERILKPYIRKDKYCSIGLRLNKKLKTEKIHQLVAMAFLNHKPNRHKLVVDHINNIRSDNRVENLQLISHRKNTSKDKKGSSIYTGVSWRKRSNKWESTIRINGKSKYLGCFNIEYDAHLAYQNELKNVL